MRNATLSQPPTLLGDVRCCVQGIRLPGMPRADRVIYARADAERTWVGNRETRTLFWPTIDSAHRTTQPTTLDDMV